MPGETPWKAALRSHEELRALRTRARRLTPAAVGMLGILALSSCSSTVQRGWEPSTKGTTNQTGRIIDLWVGSWIAALFVGVLIWGLVIWCVVAYRRRRDETGLPAQVRYNIPIEILYTIVPLMMVGVLFYYTARDQAAIADTSAKPDVTIGVVGKQWSWDFNYLDSNVYDTGVQTELDGTPQVEDRMPTLWLPVDQRVEFRITSRDVVHSFWVPAFLYKLDAIPGITNTFQVVPQREGTFAGKCSELCGEFHSQMLFNVKVVSQGEYDQHVRDLRTRGQVGELGSDLDRGSTTEGRSS